jgi:hypothetical protein
MSEPTIPHKVGFIELPQVGDVVDYLPGVENALLRDSSGNYLWNIGREYPSGLKRSPGRRPVKIPGGVHQIESDEVEGKIKDIRRGQAPKTALIPLSPRASWKAAVTAVNADGTLNLDITSHLGGLTYQYAGVMQDATRTKGNTWSIPAQV